MKTPFRLGALACAAALALSACGGAGDASATDCDDVVVADSTLRVPPAANAAAYFVVTNEGDEDTAITAAAGDFATVFELHETSMDDDGTMSMGAIEGQEIAVPAGGSVTLEPGGLHVMALDVADDVGGRETVDLALTLADGCELDVTLTVEALGENPMDDMDDDMNGMDDDGDAMSEDDMAAEEGATSEGDVEGGVEGGEIASTIDVGGLHAVDVALAEGAWDPAAHLETLRPTLDSVATYGGEVDISELEVLLADLVTALEKDDRETATALAAAGHSLAHDLEHEMEAPSP